MGKKSEKLAEFFCSKSAEMKILLCKGGMGIKLYETIFFIYVVRKLSLFSKCTLKKEVLWFFSNGLRFGILLTVDN